MKVDARHGVKGLFPANEGYFLDARSGAHPLAATCWALSHLHALHLTSHPLTLYHLDEEAHRRTADLLADHLAAHGSIDHMTSRLLSAIAAPPKLESCVKGFFFDQMAGKLTQLARSDSNEIVPTDLQAMAESLMSGLAGTRTTCENTP
ncbi:MAG: hypothetical protein H7840_09365 [Alphaproteobacteria bacterium]